MASNSILMRNYSMGDGRVGDILVVKNGNQLRSPNAVFDPAKKSSSDLLSQAPALGDILNGVA